MGAGPAVRLGAEGGDEAFEVGGFKDEGLGGFVEVDDGLLDILEGSGGDAVDGENEWRAVEVSDLEELALGGELSWTRRAGPADR